VPCAEKAILHLANGKDLTIRSNVKGEKPTTVSLNGRVINGYAINVKDLLCGGEIIFS
jgi:hypothetical protein